MYTVTCGRRGYLCIVLDTGIKINQKNDTTMKRILSLALLLTGYAILTACTPSEDTPAEPQRPDTPVAPDDGGTDGDPTAPDGTTPSGSRPLVLFASRTGNTRAVAEMIASRLDCDIIEIEPSQPYDEDYNAQLQRAQEEIAAIGRGDYPAISTTVENLDSYDVILAGYPIWYGSMASPMQTFLHENAERLAGKRIALFATSGSSGMSASADEAAELCPDAEILPQTLLLTSSTLSQAESRIDSWLKQLDIQTDNNSNDNMSSNTINLTVKGTTFTATLADNAATRALKQRLAQGDIVVRMNDYGDMEKVGQFGFTLPTENRQTTTDIGDMVLYQGNSLVIFYGRNSWSYTPLGKVDNVSTRERMIELMGGKGEIELTLSLD